MMDKYYEVTTESKLYESYFKWLANHKEVNDSAKAFMEELGIETKEYYASGAAFYIVPTKSDKEKFSTVLCADSIEHGLRRFKKTSYVGKAWKAKNITVLRKPAVTFEYYNHCYSGSSRLFHNEETNKVYFELNSKDDVNETPTGFVEMKASEFYKVIEDIQSR